MTDLVKLRAELRADVLTAPAGASMRITALEAQALLDALDAMDARLATAERTIVDAEALAVRMQRERDEARAVVSNQTIELKRLYDQVERLRRERDEARQFIGKLVHMQSNGGWSRAVIREAAAEFLEASGGNPVAAKDTTPDFVKGRQP